MKKCKNSLIYLLFLGFISFQPDSVLADNSDKNVNIKFVYEKIEEIVDIGKLSAPEIIQLKKEMKEDGCEPIYSDSDYNYIYKVRKTVVSTEEELIETCNVEYLSIGEFIERSDIISVHME